jgi:hypothetical protein
MNHRIFSALLTIILLVALAGLLTGWTKDRTPIDESRIFNAVSKSLPILQKGGYDFTRLSSLKCASCHQTSLTSMTVALAKQKGISVVDSFSRLRTQSMIFTLQQGWNDNIVDQFITSKFVGPYLLLGLDAEKYPPDNITDITVDIILNQARPDGSFHAEAARVPLESGEIHLAALSMRSLQLYAAASKKERVDAVVANARSYFEKADPSMQQEIVFQLLGLYWSHAGKEKINSVAKQLLSLQEPDGSWKQLTSMKGDAYATGQALYALFECGNINKDDPAYLRGIEYLLRTQDESGAWIVETRAYAIQPFFNSHFPPYDENQFISATATNWATMDLLNMLPETK